MVLTRNIRDFDFLDQLMSGGRVILYRKISKQQPNYDKA
jgi:hypothetical protein